MPTVTMTCSNEDCEAPYDAEVTVSGRYLPAKVDGPWENCHPAEYPDIEATLPAVCATCGEPLDTPDNQATAVEKFEDDANNADTYDYDGPDDEPEEDY